VGDRIVIVEDHGLIAHTVATALREWVSIDDPESNDHLRYTFDVSFLLSSYTCIYGPAARASTPARRTR
jgi:hypothetical protein